MSHSHIKDLYTKKRSLELDWEQELNNEGRYTLSMVRIDEAIKNIINHIKIAEAKDASVLAKVENAAATFSIAG